MLTLAIWGIFAADTLVPSLLILWSNLNNL